MLRLATDYQQQMNPVWGVHENIELLTRVIVRENMISILPNLGTDLVEELSDVLFNIVYPTYEKSMGTESRLDNHLVEVALRSRSN